MSNVASNIREIRVSLKKSQSEFGAMIGATRGQIGSYEEGRAEPKAEITAKICQLFSITQDELFNKKLKFNKDSSVKYIQQIATGIPLYNSLVHAGSPAYYNDEVNEPPVTYYIPGFQDCDVMVPVSGDSMYPDFTAGDIIICKKVDTELFIQWGHAHLVDTIQGLVLKVLMPDENPEMVKLVSVNQKFPPYTLPKEEVKKVWIVKGKLKKSLI